MTQTHCGHCRTLLTPGAPFCLSCFMPLEDEPPPATAEAPAEQPVAVGGPAPAPGGDFFAAPPPVAFASHPGQGGDWRAAAPAAALLTPQPRRAAARTPLVVAGVVCALLLVGGVLGARALFSSPPEKAAFATAFREARPPDFLPTFPDLTSLHGANPEGPGDAQAFVQAVDERVRAGNAALLAMQGTLDRWAAGKATDDDVRAGIQALDAALEEIGADGLAAQAPGSALRGMGKLTEATVGYRVALGALQDWMDSRSKGSRLTFRLTVGTANADWDAGVVALYRAGGIPAPPLPHPQPER